MSQPKLDDAIQTGRRYHQAGRLTEAEKIYRQILAHQPNHADALHLLGVLAGQVGRLDAAVELIRRAIAICSTDAFYLSSLGNVLQASGQLHEAVASYRQAIGLKPDYASAHNNLGVALQAMGQFEQAVVACRQAIGLKPDYAEAHNNLGVALLGMGQLDQAIAASRDAIGLKPDYAEAHNNLGIAFHDKGQFDEAVASCQQAVLLKPGYAEAHYNLGNALVGKGQVDEAIASYRQAIGLKPEYTDAYYNLGIALSARGKLEEAIAAHRQAVGLKPDFVEAHFNLGNALQGIGQPKEAIVSYQQAIRLKPDYAKAHNNLGVVLHANGRVDEAIVAYHQAIGLAPDYAEVYDNLGNALKDTGQFHLAIASYRKAIELKPDAAKGHNNLGNAQKDMGQLDEAIVSYRHALRLRPDLAGAHSNLILTLHYHPGYDAKMILGELRRWNEQHAEPRKKVIAPHANDRDPDRPLRIGYVSADFRQHACAHFLLPLFCHHDRRQFEVTCYADVANPDNMTQRLRDQVQCWHKINGRTDAEVSALIRENQIDILVDLAGHTADNRLQCFAGKPAPIQVTYLGYPNSTGLSAIDYRLTDAHADPPGLTDAFCTEWLIRLPQTFLCFRPSEESPVSSALPALASGQITFGCFNALAKITAEMAGIWSQILRCLPQSRLMLKCRGLSDEDARRRLRELFPDIAADRLVLHDWIDSRRGHLALYDQVDIALDSYPYHGTTTTCEAMWMGVPVITLAGTDHRSRVGVSLMSNVGLPELIAQTPEQYVQIAADLANDLPRLAELRRTLRSRMQASPLMDAPRFARNVEAAYRQMWRTWCETQAGDH